jgi:signal transduction histidine kinase
MNQRPEEKSSVCGCFTLSGDGHVLEVNRTASDWLGFQSAEMVGRPFHTFLGSGGQFFFQSQIVPMVMLKGNLEEVYLRMRLKAGGTMPVLANVGRFLRADGTTLAFEFMRIQQRGRLEDELLLAKKQAEQANDAKTKFLGMMSHELRTPLGVISLNNQLLLAGECGEMTAAQKEAVETSEGAVISVASLIDDILNFAQMRGGPVQVNLARLPVRNALDKAVVSLRHRFELAGLTCVVHHSDPPLVGKYDANRLQQILLNLLTNALKFTPRGGVVTLRDRADGDLFAIDVTDTGWGIPPEHLQRVFEPFVQLNSAIESSEKPGVGLGLAICRDLAVAMGGRITVQSTMGSGSTFSVVLQQAEQASA